MKQPKSGEEKSNTKYYVAGAGGIAITCFLVWLFAFSGFFPLPPPPTPTPIIPISSLTLSSHVDKEDVSDLEYAVLYLQTPDAEFESWEDIRDITTNFDMETRKLAEDLTFDLTNEDYAWLCICPSGYGSELFNEYWKLLYGGVNRDFQEDVYDDPINMSFCILDSNLDVITVASHQTNGNYSIVGDVDHFAEMHADSTQLHVGANWDMTDAKFDDLSATKQAEYYDQKYWNSYDPLYDSDVDLMDVSPRYALEYYTNCPAFKFTFNTTVSDNINFTLSDDTKNLAVVVEDGVYIYMVFHESLTFLTGIQSWGYEIEYNATAIELSDVDFGRATVPTRGVSAFDLIADI